jgi:NADH-quinone oxidoreductase subunit E
MTVAFSEENKKWLAEEVGKYPIKHSAVIPALHAAQRQFGWLSEDVMRMVADELGVPVSDVQAVATFYTMFRTKPVGRHHIQVCQNLSCSMFGAESLLGHLEKTFGIRAGEVTPDGRFSLARVECLAACGTAPVVQINDTYHEGMTLEKLDAVLSSLK